MHQVGIWIAPTTFWSQASVSFVFFISLSGKGNNCWHTRLSLCVADARDLSCVTVSKVVGWLTRRVCRGWVAVLDKLGTNLWKSMHGSKIDINSVPLINACRYHITLINNHKTTRRPGKATYPKWLTTHRWETCLHFCCDTVSSSDVNNGVIWWYDRWCSSTWEIYFGNAETPQISFQQAIMLLPFHAFHVGTCSSCLETNIINKKQYSPLAGMNSG